ncbi:MAG: paraquat-inducible protein A [Thiotrichaceae bacterium]|nr:paraquat-inducible protein A [Thiotrichaceae bacterium]
MKQNITGKSLGLVSCLHCEQISQLPNDYHGEKVCCPRCQARLHSRIPNSLDKTTAFILTAALMYVPANIFPIMNIVYLGEAKSDTIIGGVLHLLEGGMWPMALIVFVASILVPVLKLIVMSILIISVHLKAHWRPAGRTHLFLITEFMGRWSMVDIFVLAILIALVQFGNLASVDAGLGAFSYAVVVIFTILAARSFDPRLIWDVIEEPQVGDHD